jgi:cob(I)alamin adenosyltransferase
MVMTDYSKRVFEMLVRVMVFRSTHQDLIGKDSSADQILQKVDAAFKKISAQATQQASGKNAVRLSSGERTTAREDLRQLLESISRTAASMGLKQFFMPRDRSDRAVADVARIYAKTAEPFKREFVTHLMPEDFIDRLNTGIEKLERAIEQQAASKSSRKSATAAISGAQAEALSALTRLDPIMDNLLQGNSPVKAAWNAARRIERAQVSKKSPGKEETDTRPTVTALIPAGTSASAGAA